MFLMFLIDGFVLFSFAVTEKELYKIILVISLSIVVCGLIKFLYTKNKIRSGGYVNDHPKKYDTKAGKAGLAGIIGINIGRMLDPHLSNNGAFF